MFPVWERELVTPSWSHLHLTSGFRMQALRGVLCVIPPLGCLLAMHPLQSSALRCRCVCTPVFMCVCVFVYACVCERERVSICVGMFVFVYKCVCQHERVSICVCLCLCVFVYSVCVPT